MKNILRALIALTMILLWMCVVVKLAYGREVRWHKATASVFDAYALGGDVACGSFYGGYIVAHKSLPCGTKIRFMYRGRKKTARVADRGPFIPGRTFDLDVKLQRYLRFPFGVGAIQWRRIK